MTITELKSHIGSFGKIDAGPVGYKKHVPGWIKEMDMAGNVWFVCTSEKDYFFKFTDIDDFTPVEFTPLPEMYDGKKIIYKDSIVVFAETGEEVDLMK